MDDTGCIAELKNTFHSEGQPINDDNVTLQKFCVKLETILRHEQKGGYRCQFFDYLFYIQKANNNNSNNNNSYFIPMSSYKINR